MNRTQLQGLRCFVVLFNDQVRCVISRSGERPFECSLCKTAFTTNGNMHRHMRIHDKEHALSLNAENIDGSFSPVTPLSQNRTPRSKKRAGIDFAADDSGDSSPMTTPGTKRKPPHDLASSHPAAKRIVFDKDANASSSGRFSNDGNETDRAVFDESPEVCSNVMLANKLERMVAETRNERDRK